MKTPKKKKEKLGLKDSLKYIVGSRYLGFIVLLVVCYGISINLVEVMWKGQASILYPTKDSFNQFMGGVQIYTGIATVLFMLIGTNIMRKFSWFTAAFITPSMIFATGLIFFGFIIFKDSLEPLVSPYGFTAVQVVTFIGLLQNVLSKGVKYSLFDPTKEMSYIPLDDELKSKGKAAVDVIGGRAGKSGGAAIQLFLFSTGLSLVELAPAISIIFTVILFAWFKSVSGLNKMFLNLTEGHH
jgi:AAA family ATP:ADP antiporter